MIDALAAHYVLGTLRGPARRRFQRLLADDAVALAAVARWEIRLAPVAYGVDAVAPPPSVRAALLGEALRSKVIAMPARPARASTAPEPIPLPARPRSTAAARLRFLAAASVCGVLIIGGLIALAGGRLSFPTHSITVAAPAPQAAPVADVAAIDDPAERLPMVVARVGMPASSMGWMISLSPDHRQLQITASDDYFSAGRASVQLWWLAGDDDPRPLAILGTERDSTVTVDVPPGLADDGQTLVFAITLEPLGGSPTGRPTRPVLSVAGSPRDI